MFVILYSRTKSIWLSATAEKDARDATLAIVTRGDTVKRMRRRDLVEGFPSLAAADEAADTYNEAAEIVARANETAKAMRKSIRNAHGIK